MAVVTPVETADNRPIEEIFAGDVTAEALKEQLVEFAEANGIVL